MPNRLLSISTTILRLIHGKKLWVNIIIEQTSRDRSYVIRVLNEMEKAKLLLQGSRKIGKKRSVELTPLGNELASFYNDFDNFTKSYFEIIKYRNEIYVESDDRSTRNRILKDRKWDADDIEHDRYENLQSLLGSYKGAFFSDMLEIVHHRSLKILNRNKVDIKSKRNEIIKVILEGIILNVIAFTHGNLYSTDPRTLTRSGGEFDLEEWINSTEKRLVGFLNWRSEESIPFFAMNEVRQLSSSFLKLINPSKNTLLSEVHELEGMIEDCKKYKSENGLKHIGLNPLLETTREYLNKF